MALSDNAAGDVGIVYQKINGIYTVHPLHRPGSLAICELSPRLQKRCTQALAVGDLVRFVRSSANSGWIVAVLPRRNAITRRGITSRRAAHSFEQVIAANLDQVIPVFAAARPAPHWNLLDRYLVTAESAGLPAQICITKLDLAREPHGSINPAIQMVANEYRRIGYPVHLVSVFTSEGLAELRKALQGQISVLVGKSGVGKTSLLKAIQPGIDLPVKDVNPTTGKGKHTTTRIEMIDLDSGGAILDTPGVREFGLWDVDTDELGWFFPEMRPFVGKCRFGLGCAHDQEPGCAVRQAVLDGLISPRRYNSYLRLRQDGGRP